MRRSWVLGVVVAVVAVLAVGSQGLAAPLYFTGTYSNMVWVANTDGTVTPSVLFSPAAASIQGPVGIEYVPSTGKIYYGGGFRCCEVYVANADGTGSPATLANTIDVEGDQLDVSVDLANDRIFFTTGWYETVHSGNLDGSGTATEVLNVDDPPVHHAASSVVYDSSADVVYYTRVGRMTKDVPGSIWVHNADGSGSSTVLFDSSDGVTYPRDLAIDVANGRIYFVQSTGSWTCAHNWQVMGGNLDGSGTLSTLYSDSGVSSVPRCIDIDVPSGMLYWTAFVPSNQSPYQDWIMTGNADGSGTPTALYSGDFGSVRGISIGPTADLIPEPATMVLLGLGVAGLGRYLRRRRTA